ncbi:response regulator transcription factor [Streptomyces kebangsaanensis]|uniref:response regulator transcription factor n=1 Tax=Streptomyces kebangsaanensis TaxID=864058 RepID=UPI002D218F1B|nr:response regulator transcription factor [Streptomyces kebangsaanensis]
MKLRVYRASCHGKDSLYRRREESNDTYATVRLKQLFTREGPGCPQEEHLPQPAVLPLTPPVSFQNQGGRNVLPQMESWRFLLVEPDERWSQPLTQILRRNGHNPHVVADGASALKEHHRHDAVLLDLELPDVDGLEVCRAIRVVCDTPVFAVTFRDSELDRVLGFQAGVDDYVVKPYGAPELLARISAVMRRARPHRPASPHMRLGPLTIERETRSVLLHGRTVPVTLKEFELLLLLASQPGTVVSRRQILQQVWQDIDVRRSRTIDTHVSSLRRKLGSGSWIITVRGVGFKLENGSQRPD